MGSRQTVWRKHGKHFSLEQYVTTTYTRARCCSPDGGDLAAVRFQMDAWSSGMMYIISMYVCRYDMSAREAGAQTSNCSKSSSNTDSNCSGSLGPYSEQAIDCAIGLSNWNPRRQMCHLLRI